MVKFMASILLLISLLMVYSGSMVSYSIARALSCSSVTWSMLAHVLSVVADSVSSTKSFWRTRALSAFAKLYAALHMLFLRLLHINLSTDLFST